MGEMPLGPAPLLADLGKPPSATACPLAIHAGQQLPPPVTSLGLAELPRRGLRRPVAGFPVAGRHPGCAKGRSRNSPDLRVVLLESGRDLAPRLRLAADQVLVRPAQRGAMGQGAADGDHPRPFPADSPALRRAGRLPPSFSRAIEHFSVRTRCCCSHSGLSARQFEGDPCRARPGFSEALTQRMRIDNPLDTYPRLRESLS